MAAKKPRRRPARPEDIYELRRVRDPQISPDGNLVAYAQAHTDRAKDRAIEQIWIAPVSGEHSPREFTRGPSTHSPRWSPGGDSLLFVSNRGEGNQLYVAPLDGGDARPITTGPGTPTGPQWSPDGKSVVFVRSVGPRRGREASESNAPLVVKNLYYRFDGFGLFDARRRHLFVVNVESGKERQLTSGDWHDSQPSWSPDGKWIAFSADRSRRRWSQGFRSDLWLVPAKGGKARRLTRERGDAQGPEFSPDGSEVAFVGHEHEDRSAGRNYALYTVPLRGSTVPRPVIADFDRSISPAPSGRPFVWTPDGTGLVFLAGDRGTVPIWRVERASGAAKKIVDGNFQAGSVALTPDAKRVVFTSSWSSAFPEVMCASLRRERSQITLSTANRTLRERVALGRTERIQYRGDDGLELEAFVLYPPDHKKSRRSPTVLEIHGGPHGMHPATFNIMRTQALAGAGFVVLLPNPRGSTSYGEGFERACIGDWGGGDYRDLMAGVDALVEAKVANPDQLYLSGYSYGGYMSSWTVGQTNRFRAAAIGAPITDLMSGLGTDDIPRYNIESMGGPPETAFELYHERSPLTHIRRVRTPVLLLHWEGDLRCPIGQSEQFFAGLKLLGRKVEFVRYPGGSHGVRSPSQDVDYAERELAWFDAHAPKTSQKSS